MGSVSESSVRSRAKGCGAEELTGLKGSREDEVVVYEKKLSRCNAWWRWLGKMAAYGLTVGNRLVRAAGGCAAQMPPTLPEGMTAMPPSKETEIMGAMERLQEKKGEWVQVSTDARADMLAECLKRVPDIAKQAAAAAVRHHGSYGGGLGDELITWMPVADAIAILEGAMRAGGQPDLPAVSRKENGQYVVDVFPERWTSLLFGNTRAEVWILPGEKPTQGLIYRNKMKGLVESSVAVILGAGNQVALTVLDILHMLLVEDRVVAMKMNEVNAYLGPYIVQVLAPFFEQGFVEMIYGGLNEGRLLCDHAATKAIHLTGAASTFNRILWGSPDPKNRIRVLPRDKIITGELGNVTPYIIVPGDWTDEEMTYQAKSILSGLFLNSGHNCLALEVIITSKQWPLREKFLERIRSVLSSCYRQSAWYPGSKEKFQAFRNRFTNHTIEEYGQQPESGSLPPWLFVSGLSPDEAEISTENWCGVLQEVCIDVPGDDTEQYLDQAVSFANSCWGSLTCAIFIDPRKQSQHSTAFDNCLKNLKFGSIMVNAPCSVAYSATSICWGAYPGNSLEDIGSGNCMMNNTLLLDHPEKSILYFPWKFLPHPFWFFTLTNKAKAFEKVINFTTNPSIFAVLQLVPQVLFATSH